MTGIQMSTGSSASNGNSKPAGITPDDRDRVAVEHDGAADQLSGRVRTDRRQRPFGDERGPHRASRIVAGAEQAALHRCDAEHREEIGRDDRERDRDRLAAIRSVAAAVAYAAHAIDGRRLRLPVEEIEVGGVVGLVADGRARWRRGAARRQTAAA